MFDYFFQINNNMIKKKKKKIQFFCNKILQKKIIDLLKEILQVL